jgi:hypothetical protein
MVKLFYFVIAFAFLIGIFALVSYTSSSQKINPLQQAYNDINFPNGDHIIFYQPAQQVLASASQLSKSPLLPWKFLGVDTHGDVIAQNTTTNTIINTTAQSPEGKAILSPGNITGLSNSGTYLTASGQGVNMASGSAETPTTTELCHLGQICNISGKVMLADASSCHIQTVNGVQKNVCSYVSGPFKYMIQVICVDTNAYRCSAISGDLPTTGAGFTDLTSQDGSFSYNWTPQGDNYFVGNYIARMNVESISTGANGLIVTDTGDYAIQVVS